MNILHRIKAYLYENLLTADPNDYIARVASERSLGVQEICEASVNRGGADVSSQAMQHAVELFLKEMAYQLSDGYAVNTGYFTAHTQIRGVFNSPSETFNSEKHNILFQFNQGEKLRQEIPHIEVQILGLADSTTAILQVLDVKSGTVNDVLTPNKNLKITGTKIKIAGEEPANGIYFVNQSTEARTKVEASEIVVNNPSELIVVIPDLASGTYKVEVVTQYAVSTMLNDPRTAKFDKVLTVE